MEVQKERSVRIFTVKNLAGIWCTGRLRTKKKSSFSGDLDLGFLPTDEGHFYGHNLLMKTAFRHSHLCKNLFNLQGFVQKPSSRHNMAITLKVI